MKLSGDISCLWGTAREPPRQTVESRICRPQNLGSPVWQVRCFHLSSAAPLCLSVKTTVPFSSSLSHLRQQVCIWCYHHFKQMFSSMESGAGAGLGLQSWHEKVSTEFNAVLLYLFLWFIFYWQNDRILPS